MKVSEDYFFFENSVTNLKADGLKIVNRSADSCALYASRIFLPQRNSSAKWHQRG